MRPILLILLLAGVGITGWMILSRPGKKEPVARQQAMAVSKNSEALNADIAGLLTVYNKLSESFVHWDSTNTKTLADSLNRQLATLSFDSLQRDTSGIFETAQAFIENAKGDAQTIAAEPGIRQQREAFNSLSDNFYQFLNVVKYDRQRLYLQECPMAFDDTKSALWLSEKQEIRNPYLGLHHPTYGKGMLACGETKIKLNNTGEAE
jgi:hypothetical protein